MNKQINPHDTLGSVPSLHICFGDNACKMVGEGSGEGKGVGVGIPVDTDIDTDVDTDIDTDVDTDIDIGIGIGIGIDTDIDIDTAINHRSSLLTHYPLPTIHHPPSIYPSTHHPSPITILFPRSASYTHE